jgi:hypothetical protein
VADLLRFPHRVVELPVKTLDDLAREHRDAHPDLIEQLRAHRPSTLERIGDALASPRMFTFYLGFYAGCMVTVGSAIIAARVFQ